MCLFIYFYLKTFDEKLKHSKDKEENIKWTNKPIKTLGIYYGHDYIECEKLNWEKKIENMNSLFLSWSKRNLSILGKVLIIKALIIPIFTFIVSSCVKSTTPLSYFYLS
jgi:hypothetical protein